MEDVGGGRDGGLGSLTSPSSGEEVKRRFARLLPSGDLEAFLLRGVGTMKDVALKRNDLRRRRRRRPACQRKSQSVL